MVKVLSMPKIYVKTLSGVLKTVSESNFDFLCKCIEVAIKSGAKTINIPDTMGYAIPEEFKKLIKKIKK